MYRFFYLSGIIKYKFFIGNIDILNTQILIEICKTSNKLYKKMNALLNKFFFKHLLNVIYFLLTK